MIERDFWRGVIQNKYLVPNDYPLGELTVELLDYLSSTDRELRDTFAYNILARWIIIYSYYGASELRAMLEWLVPRMTESLGEQNTDTVFLRSYAALVLSLIVYRDNQTGFLTEVEIRSLLDKARHYLVSEQDTRAYVAGKGWANACGHAADLLKFSARNPLLESLDLLRILDALADKLTLSTQEIYVHDEDDRLAQVAMAVLRRDALTSYELSGWLRRFLDWRDAQVIPDGEFNPVYHVAYQNIRNFLRSLYCYMNLAPLLPLGVQDFEVDVAEAVRVFSL